MIPPDSRSFAFLLAQLDGSSILPDLREGWVYYALCAAFFTLCGLCCGYFVWRKGHMQMLDAEMEVRRTAEELQALRQDLSAEERELRPQSETLDDLLSVVEPSAGPGEPEGESKPSAGKK